VDPAKGDFRVKDGSPALALGFKNFPMDQFGVKKASLKAIARTPIIPELRTTEDVFTRRSGGARKPDQFKWLGATLKPLRGQEFSAYGVSQEVGGVALTTVPPACAAARAGLKNNDVIQVINGHKASNTRRFNSIVRSYKGKPLTLKVVRDQKSMELTVAQ